MTAKCPSCQTDSGRVLLVRVQDVRQTVVSFRCPQCHRVWSQTIDEPVATKADAPRILPFRRDDGMP